MFIDKALITVEGGTGGSGATSFRREWRTPMGGPDGGDGGRGGSVIVRGDSNLATLLDYTYRDKWVAERGEHGMGSNKSGRSGADVVMPVPPGTILRDAASGEIVAEILEDGQEAVIIHRHELVDAVALGVEHVNVFARGARREINLEQTVAEADAGASAVESVVL